MRHITVTQNTVARLLTKIIRLELIPSGRLWRSVRMIQGLLPPSCSISSQNLLLKFVLASIIFYSIWYFHYIDAVIFHLFYIFMLVVVVFLICHLPFWSGRTLRLLSDELHKYIIHSFDIKLLTSLLCIYIHHFNSTSVSIHAPLLSPSIEIPCHDLQKFTSSNAANDFSHSCKHILHFHFLSAMLL